MNGISARKPAPAAVAGESLEQKSERLRERERRDWKRYLTLTARQRQQPRWKPFVEQAQNAARVALLLLATGEEPPPELKEVLKLRTPAPPPGPPGSPSGLFPTADPTRASRD